MHRSCESRDPVRHKRLVERDYVVFLSDVPDEMVAAQLIFDFENHVMPAGMPPGTGSGSWLGATHARRLPDMRVPGGSVRAGGNVARRPLLGARQRLDAAQ